MKNVQETSRESYIAILETLGDRHQACMEGLEELGACTANELAKHLADKGVTKYFDRNFVHPRLNELVEKQLVVIQGKKVDPISHRRCMTYSVIGGAQ